MRHIKVLRYVIPLFFYTLSIAFFMNQPIELINPFEYYHETELKTLAIYLMILLIHVSMLGYVMGFHASHCAQLSLGMKHILLLFSVVWTLLVSRMSILLMIVLTLYMVAWFYQRHLTQRTLQMIVIFIYLVALFVVLIPMMLLLFNYESFLNVSQFQEFIAINHRHEMISYISLNITYFIRHLCYYLFIWIVGIMPGVLLGLYHAQRKVMINTVFIQTLILLIIGTALKLLVTHFSHHFLQFSIVLTGSSLQGLGVMLMLFGLLNHIKGDMHFNIRLFLASIVLIDTVIYGLFTGLNQLDYPAQTIQVLFQQSIVVAIVIALIYSIVSIILNKKLKKTE
ncbi:hypothetical protein [Macrococcoides caseolyticum]|uniref:hypothetical protein n=1 Tax=Macrococcoides caseolyticum TaxID=69966 RepID=UPI001F41F613|nr:hypothetical protein [Macrococcus caseolyticus]MCE4955752.1 hypothetical protein [Macrococcus caseolyticus]